MKYRLYSDGASRGNPGPSAIAFLVLNENDNILTKRSERVGVKTNNQAEYEALISALEYVSHLDGQDLSCYLDSELVVKQLNGEYRVHNPRLRQLWLRVQELKNNFQTITFEHVSRTDRRIVEVDRAANRALDAR